MPGRALSGLVGPVVLCMNFIKKTKSIQYHYEKLPKLIYLFFVCGSFASPSFHRTLSHRWAA